MTDAKQFGPAKVLANAMLAEGIDLTDPTAIDRWMRG